MSLFIRDKFKYLSSKIFSLSLNNGDISIKGSNITIEADNNLVVTSRKNLTLSGKNSIFLDTPNLNTNALTGNLAPRGVTFGGRTFAGTKVGQDVISNAFNGGFG